jgi:hypothetical protein
MFLEVLEQIRSMVATAKKSTFSIHAEIFFTCSWRQSKIMCKVSDLVINLNQKYPGFKTTWSQFFLDAGRCKSNACQTTILIAT